MINNGIPLDLMTQLANNMPMQTTLPVYGMPGESKRSKTAKGAKKNKQQQQHQHDHDAESDDGDIAGESEQEEEEEEKQAGKKRKTCCKRPAYKLQRLNG